MHDFFQDVRYGLRMLLKTPVVAAIAAVSLSVGIAANTTVFSVANGFIFAPFPYENQDELVLVTESHRSTTDDEYLSPGNFLDYRERSTVFQDLIAYDVVPANLTGGPAPERVRLSPMSPETFEMLGRPPALGRNFESSEGVAGAGKVVVLAFPFWQRYFGGEPVLGRTVDLDGVRHTVIGVMPEAFDFLPANVDLFRPTNWEDRRDDRESRGLLVMGRLADGRRLEEAEAELAAIASQLEREYPEANEGYGVHATTLREYFPGRSDTVLSYVNLTVAAFVLLIACANIANLLLARAEDRQREVAVRTALGAGRKRILRQLLTESTLLALIGGGLGTLQSIYGVRWAASAMPAELPRSFLPTMDGTVLLFTLGVSLLAGLIFGVAPALHTFGDLRESLGDGSRGGTASRGRSRLRSAFVIAEFACALALLIGAAVLLKVFNDVIMRDPGVVVENVVTTEITAAEDRYPDDGALRRFYRSVIRELEETPGVLGVAAMIDLPRSRGVTVSEFLIDGRPRPVENDEPRTGWQAVNAAYFSALEVPVVAGRTIESSDREDTQLVAAVNESFVQTFFPDEDPVGRTITLLDAPRQIVGVTRNVFQSRMPEEGGRIGPAVYVPMEQVPRRTMSLAIRVQGDPTRYASVIREAVWSVDPEQPVAAVMTLQEHIDMQLSGPRALSVVMTLFGAAALLLSALGIYGVVSHSVVQRTRELGIRMALGAGSTDVVRLVAGQGMKLALVGLLAGAPMAFALVQAIHSIILTSGLVGPATVAAVVLALTSVALVAAYLPARRASRLAPVRALQME